MARLLIEKKSAGRRKSRQQEPGGCDADALLCAPHFMGRTSRASQKRGESKIARRSTLWDIRKRACATVAQAGPPPHTHLTHNRRVVR